DVLELSYSPITGGEGNIEFLAHLRKVPESGTINSAINMAEVVSNAHEQFDHK
ncbi:TlyA family rRNA (cytidine-2'-O)-methyltransferase, partial [Pseudomonas ogarae]